MRVNGPIKTRWSGYLAIIMHLCALVVLVVLIAAGTDTLRSVTSSIAQLAGVRSAPGGALAVTVDSSGRIAYRSNRVAGNELVGVLKREMRTSADAVLTIRADSRADSAVVAQIMAAAKQAGAAQVRLSVIQTN